MITIGSAFCAQADILTFLEEHAGLVFLVAAWAMWTQRHQTDGAVRRARWEFFLVERLRNDAALLADFLADLVVGETYFSASRSNSHPCAKWCCRMCCTTARSISPCKCGAQAAPRERKPIRSRSFWSRKGFWRVATSSPLIFPPQLSVRRRAPPMSTGHFAA